MLDHTPWKGSSGTVAWRVLRIDARDGEVDVVEATAAFRGGAMESGWL